MVELVAEAGEAEVLTSSPEPVANADRRTGLLHNRNLQLLWFGESISLLGDQFYLVALPWLVLQLTGSALAVGTILAVAGVPRALLMLVGGVFTDRLSPRVIMLVSNGSRIVSTAVLTLLVITSSVQVWMLYALSLAFGVVDAFFHPAYMAMIPMLVKTEELESSNTALQGTSLLISAIGPGIGGALVKLAGTAFSFLLDTVSFAVATFTLLLMNPIKRLQAPTKHASVLADIREAVSYIAGDELLRPMMFIVMALNFLFVGPLMVGPAVMAKERFIEQGSVALGVLLSAMGAGSLLGMFAASMLKPTRLGVVTLLTVAVAGLGIVAAGYAASLGLAAVLFAVVGASSGFSNLLLITWLQRRISKEMMGRVMSIVMLSSMGLMPISSAVAGVIAQQSLTLLFALNGSLLVVTVILSLLNPVVRSMRA